MHSQEQNKTRVTRRLSGSRSIELTLAALLSGGALFTSFVTDAAPQSAGLEHWPLASSNILPPVSHNVSAGTRAAMAEVLSRSGSALRLLPAGDATQRGEEAGALHLTPDIAIRANTHTSARPDGSGSSLGIALAARTASSADLPPVFIVGGVGRETYMIAPRSPRDYALIPAGSETSLGDAHIGIGVQLNPTIFATAGYVREKRRYSSGNQGWSEEEHFAGIALRARW